MTSTRTVDYWRNITKGLLPAVAFLAGLWIGRKSMGDQSASANLTPPQNAALPALRRTVDRSSHPSVRENKVGEAAAARPSASEVAAGLDKEISDGNIEQLARRREPADSAALSRLGLTSQQIEEFNRRRRVLHSLAVSAGDTRAALATARLDFDQMMKSTLNTEGYEAYRAYEASKIAQREVSVMVGEVDKADEPDIQAVLVGLIGEAGVQTATSWDGPYDPLPEPSVGAVAVQKVAQNELADLEKTTQVLFQMANSKRLPSETLVSLKNYYRLRMDGLRRIIQLTGEAISGEHNQP
jgi:hypothetical protein